MPLGPPRRSEAMPGSVLRVLGNSSTSWTTWLPVLGACIAASAAILGVPLTYLFASRRERDNWLREQRFARFVKLLTDIKDLQSELVALREAFKVHAECHRRVNPLFARSDEAKAGAALTESELTELREAAAREKPLMDEAHAEITAHHERIQSLIDELFSAPDLELLMSASSYVRYGLIVRAVRGAFEALQRFDLAETETDAVGDVARAFTTAATITASEMSNLTTLFRRELGSSNLRDNLRAGRSVKTYFRRPLG
jgi:hypothetical protein